MDRMDIFLCDENEHVRVCRVCLIRGVRMYDLQSYPLETYFEAIIGIPVSTNKDSASNKIKNKINWELIIIKYTYL